MSIRYSIALFTVFTLFFGSGTIGSASGLGSKETEFPKSVSPQHGIELNLTGTAKLRYLLFLDAYSGALYLPSGVDGSQALEDVPKHLVLRYHVSITSSDFAKATRSVIKDSVSPKAYAQLLPKIEMLNRWYQDVKPDDRYALTYIPDAGVTLFLNDMPLGTIQGEKFARALFSIWIGDSPIDGRFRDQLLGSL